MLEHKDLVIGIDSSTTACKAIIWDRDGNALAGGRSSLPLLQPGPARYEQPAEAWWQAAVQALREATAQVRPNRLAGLCITHQRETFAPVNELGRPLRNGILWMDERARSLLPQLENQLGKHHFHRTTGKPLTGNLTLSKIAWLKESEPETFEHAYKYLDVHAYLVFHLTGLFRTGWGCADPTGMFDMRQDRWGVEILEKVGIRPDQLPEAYPPGEVIGNVTEQAAQECGLPSGLPVVAGIGDGQAGGLGANIMHPGESYLNLGTSVISGTYSASYLVNPAFRTMYSGMRGAYLLETVILGGAYTIAWFLENFVGLGSEDSTQALEALNAVAQEIPPGALGLLLVPYWNSAMNPYWDVSARGIVVGWQGSHQKQHLYRAILEGVGFEQRLHTSGVEAALGQGITRFIAVGGGAKNNLWCQIIADITGKPVFRARTAETAALGAGILAAGGVGLYPDVIQAAQAMTSIQPAPFEPDPQRHNLYTALYEEVYRHLFPVLQPYLDRLSELSN